MFDDDGNLTSLRKTKADILSEPYAVALAGIRVSYRFDPADGVFSLTYMPDPSVAAPTVIFSAPRHYPGGYRIEVQGARITSPPCATYVTLRALPGVRRVSVVLRPGHCPAYSRPSRPFFRAAGSYVRRHQAPRRPARESRAPGTLRCREPLISRQGRASAMGRSPRPDLAAVVLGGRYCIAAQDFARFA
jgi:hypothetical protein